MEKISGIPVSPTLHTRTTFYVGRINLLRDLLDIFPEILLQLPSNPLFNRLRTYYYRRFRKMQIGQDTHLLRNVRLRGCVSLGREVCFNENCMLMATAPGKIEVGDFTIFGPGVYIRNSNHGFADLNTPIRYQPKTVEDIRIGADCWLGEGCTILAGVTIGKGAIVGAKAVVTKNVPDFAIVAGVPARIIKYRNQA